MKTKSMRIGLFLLLALVIHGAMAAQWPTVTAPPRSAVQWVAENMTQNGIPMQVKTFYSATSLDDVLTFYREKWTGNGEAAVENQLGEWAVIGRRDGDYYMTVQARSIGSNETEGFIAVNDLSALLAERASAVDEFPSMGGTSVVSNTVSYDEGREAKTLILQNDYSVDSNASFYIGELKSAGWALRTSFERPEAGRDTQLLYFERATLTCFITVADAGDGKTLIAVNLTDSAK